VNKKKNLFILSYKKSQIKLIKINFDFLLNQILSIAFET